MTPYLWALYGLGSAGVVLLVWAATTGGPGRLPSLRNRHHPEHAARPAPLRAPLGPLEEWPWGQRPAMLMLAPDGVLMNTGSDPEAWMRRMLAEIDAGWFAPGVSA